MAYLDGKHGAIDFRETMDHNKAMALTNYYMLIGDKDVLESFQKGWADGTK